MSPVVPLKWVADRQLDQAAADVLEVIQAWASSWGLPLPAGQVRSVSRIPAGGAADACGEALPGAACFGAAWRDALAEQLFGAAAEDSAVLSRVVGQLTEDLQSRLRRRFAPDLAPDLPPRASSARPGDWGAQVAVEVLGCTVTLALSCAQLGARPAQAALAAVSAERSLAQLPVRLVAEVGSTRISVADLLGLCVDDVLLLSQRLDTPTQLRSPGSSLRLHGRLGRSPQGMRAVSLLATGAAGPSS